MNLLFKSVNYKANDYNSVHYYQHLDHKQWLIKKNLQQFRCLSSEFREMLNVIFWNECSEKWKKKKIKFSRVFFFRSMIRQRKVVKITGRFHQPLFAQSVNALGGNSQKFLRQICNIFVTFRCFYNTVMHRKKIIYDFSSS